MRSFIFFSFFIVAFAHIRLATALVPVQQKRNEQRDVSANRNVGILNYVRDVFGLAARQDNQVCVEDEYYEAVQEYSNNQAFCSMLLGASPAVVVVSVTPTLITTDTYTTDFATSTETVSFTPEITVTSTAAGGAKLKRAVTAAAVLDKRAARSLAVAQYMRVAESGSSSSVDSTFLSSLSSACSCLPVSEATTTSTATASATISTLKVHVNAVLTVTATATAEVTTTTEIVSAKASSAPSIASASSTPISPAIVCPNDNGNIDSQLIDGQLFEYLVKCDTDLTDDNLAQYHYTSFSECAAACGSANHGFNSAVCQGAVFYPGASSGSSNCFLKKTANSTVAAAGINAVVLQRIAVAVVSSGTNQTAYSSSPTSTIVDTSSMLSSIFQDSTTALPIITPGPSASPDGRLATSFSTFKSDGTAYSSAVVYSTYFSSDGMWYYSYYTSYTVAWAASSTQEVSYATSTSSSESGGGIGGSNGGSGTGANSGGAGGSTSGDNGGANGGSGSGSSGSSVTETTYNYTTTTILGNTETTNQTIVTVWSYSNGSSETTTTTTMTQQIIGSSSGSGSGSSSSGSSGGSGAGSSSGGGAGGSSGGGLGGGNSGLDTNGTTTTVTNTTIITNGTYVNGTSGGASGGNGSGFGGGGAGNISTTVILSTAFSTVYSTSIAASGIAGSSGTAASGLIIPTSNASSPSSTFSGSPITGAPRSGTFSTRTPTPTPFSNGTIIPTSIPLLNISSGLYIPLTMTSPSGSPVALTNVSSGMVGTGTGSFSGSFTGGLRSGTYSSPTPTHLINGSIPIVPSGTAPSTFTGSFPGDLRSGSLSTTSTPRFNSSSGVHTAPSVMTPSASIIPKANSSLPLPTGTGVTTKPANFSLPFPTGTGVTSKPLNSSLPFATGTGVTAKPANSSLLFPTGTGPSSGFPPLTSANSSAPMGPTGTAPFTRSDTAALRSGTRSVPGPSSFVTPSTNATCTEYSPITTTVYSTMTQAAVTVYSTTTQLGCYSSCLPINYGGGYGAFNPPFQSAPFTPVTTSAA